MRALSRFTKLSIAVVGAVGLSACAHQVSAQSGTTKTTNAVGCKATATRPVCVITLPRSVSASAVMRAINRRPSGAAVVVRSKPGIRSTISGSLAINRPRVTIAIVNITGTVDFRPRARWSRLAGTRARGFSIHGADDIRIDRNRFDGLGRTSNNVIYDAGSNVPERFAIIGNTFTRYFGPRASDHSEALFIGFSIGGRIAGNTFVNNGNTAHIFFTWWGGRAQPGVTHPRNICVIANRFGRTHGAYYDVNFREEIPSTAKIRIDPRQRAGVTHRVFVRRCG